MLAFLDKKHNQKSEHKRGKAQHAKVMNHRFDNLYRESVNMA